MILLLASVFSYVRKIRRRITERGRENVVPVKLLRRGSSERLVEVLQLQGRRQRGGRGGDRPPNKIGAMTTECVLLLHALDAFQNALYTTTRIYTRADYSSISQSLYARAQ